MGLPTATLVDGQPEMKGFSFIHVDDKGRTSGEQCCEDCLVWKPEYNFPYQGLKCKACYTIAQRQVIKKPSLIRLLLAHIFLKIRLSLRN